MMPMDIIPPHDCQLDGALSSHHSSNPVVWLLWVHVICDLSKVKKIISGIGTDKVNLTKELIINTYKINLHMI